MSNVVKWFLKQRRQHYYCHYFNILLVFLIFHFLLYFLISFYLIWFKIFNILQLLSQLLNICYCLFSFFVIYSICLIVLFMIYLKNKLLIVFKNSICLYTVYFFKNTVQLFHIVYLLIFFFCIFFAFIQQVVSLFKILYKNIYVYCFLLTIKFFIVVNYVDFFC